MTLDDFVEELRPEQKLARSRFVRARQAYAGAFSFLKAVECHEISSPPQIGDSGIFAVGVQLHPCTNDPETH